MAFVPDPAAVAGFARPGMRSYNSDMATRPSARRSEYDVIEPIGKRVVVRKDDNKRQTKSGIVLPDSHEIPVITGRVIAISKAIENDEDQTIRQYDKVLFDPREAIPVELEHDNRLFVVHIDRVLAIFRRADAAKAGPGKAADAAGGDEGDEGDE
jgi:chaperonin GroES